MEAIGWVLADPKLGAIIKEKLNIPCVASRVRQ